MLRKLVRATDTSGEILDISLPEVGVYCHNHHGLYGSWNCVECFMKDPKKTMENKAEAGAHLHGVYGGCQHGRKSRAK